MPQNIAIIGTGGAIGNALTARARVLYPEAKIWGFSRRGGAVLGADSGLAIDYQDEQALAKAAGMVDGAWDMVVCATGILHTPEFGPEKSLRDLSADKFQQLFAANTIAPALIAKHFLPKLARDRRAVFATLSARVGSISDNRLGGWYSYRASKAALNMIIKNAAIELRRKAPESIVVGLHPGTVDSALSKPFQANVPAGKLFTPEFCAERLHAVLQQLTPENTGGCFAWDGLEVPA